MANSDNIGGLIETNNPQIAANGLFIPSNINTDPSPNKLLTLFNANSDKIYTKFSYFSDGGRGTGQPFITNNPNSYKRNLSSTRGFPLGNASRDLVRITRFSKSNPGLLFALRQIGLQGLQPFNETKIYNPLMPIQAAAFPGSLGLLDRPIRHIEPNLSGVFGALGLSAITNLFTTQANPSAPKGTVGSAALPYNAPGGAKGLTRGSSTSTPYKNLTSYWGTPPGSGGFLKIVGNFFRSNTLFGAFSAVPQPNGTTYKADESTYDLMITNTLLTGPRSKNAFRTTFKLPFLGSSTAKEASTRFYYKDTKGDEHYGVSQKWYSGLNLWNPPNINFGVITQTGIVTRQAGSPGAYSKGPNATITHDISERNKEKSELLTIYKSYIAVDGTIENLVATKQNSKFTDKTSDSVKQIEDNLKRVIANIKKAGYNFTPVNDDDLINPQFSNGSFNGMDFISHQTKNQGSQTQGQSPFNYNNGGYLTDFRFQKRKQLVDDQEDGKGFAGSAQSDIINILDVRDDTEKFKDRDLIKFWFYDITNKKYIPFRATVKGISERYTSNWDEFQYIGNADKVYNYKGFTRALSFNFTAVAMSLKELHPMWKRINYLLSLSKPSGYLKGSYIVPPLVQLTIGDLYKNQPIVINQLSMTIPENASWETIDELNDTNYHYYNGRITTLGSYVAQFPYEAEISVDCNILEKEIPMAGRSNFGEIDNGFFSGRLYVNLTAQQQQQEIERQQKMKRQQDMDRYERALKEHDEILRQEQEMKQQALIMSGQDPTLLVP